MNRIKAFFDWYFAHRIEVAAWLLVVGIILTGIRVPLPDMLTSLGLPATIAVPVWFPLFVPLGRVFLLIGLAGGGVGVLTRRFNLAPSQAQKLAAAAKEAARTGDVQLVKTRPGGPDILVAPTPET